jgi:hypothetical protein
VLFFDQRILRYLLIPKKIKKYGTATAETSASADRVPFKKVFSKLRLT